MAADDVYKKVYKIVTEKVNELEKTINILESENAQLKTELAVKNAKLEVYERLANISGTKSQLGFGPPIQREEE